MKVLYCNPSFWEYRLPFYVELNRLFNGDFHVVYSTKRYFGAHVNMLPKIKNVLGENAHPYENEWMYVRETHSMKIKDETYHAIPLSLGLLTIIRKIKPDVLITEGFFNGLLLFNYTDGSFEFRFLLVMSEHYIRSVIILYLKPS